MIRPAKIGPLEVREGQAHGAAPHLVLEVPVDRTLDGHCPSVAGVGLDRQQAEELRELVDEWLR